MIIVNMIAAAVIAAMAGLGIGGGGLLVIYLTLILGTPQLTAQGINLAFFLFSSTASLFVHFQKRKIDMRIVAVLAVTGVCASLAGSNLSHAVDTDLLRKIFGALLIASGVLSLTKKKHKDR